MLEVKFGMRTSKALQLSCFYLNVSSKYSRPITMEQKGPIIRRVALFFLFKEGIGMGWVGEVFQPNSTL